MNKLIGYLAVLAIVIVVFWMSAYPRAIVHCRLTVEVDTPEGLKTGSVVNQLGFSLEPAIGTTGFNVGTRHSEAVVVDLGSRGALFALIVGRDLNGNPDSGKSQAWIYMHLLAKRIYQGPGDRDIIYKLRATKAKAQLPPEMIPMLVRFRNEKDPRSVEAVDPANLAASFGEGVSLKRVTMETTTDPVTNAIGKRIGWLTDPAVIKNPGWAKLPSLAKRVVAGLKNPNN